MGLKPPAARSAALVLATIVIALASGNARAGGTITPGLAAGGIPLTAGVEKVVGLLGRPSSEFVDPTNPQIYIQRWEELCLGARYTPDGDLLALDVWADVAEDCGAVQRSNAVDVAGGREITFKSTRAEVKRAFGYTPDRVLRGGAFTILVYESAGIAFYIREQGERKERVDSITVFPRNRSRTVWAPAAWGNH